MTETWKPLRGKWGQRYEISESGQIRNIDTGRRLKLYRQRLKGAEKDAVRVIVTLALNNERKTFHVSRLVYETFKDVDLKPLQTVGFLDGDSTNLHWSNLFIEKQREPEPEQAVAVGKISAEYEQAARKGVSITDFARQHGLSDQAMLRLIGALAWNALREEKGLEPESIPAPRVRPNRRK
ncbi:NUMOD4 domain-containing protein [Geoalkalibacter subterraneus]|uniref:NUMOD4 domain-containing protein n=1 Tax=Geoalkalibacter subterraneus TaxID=483547 RepID=A0A0B5FX98_9BACT|nr:NUMOD4 domain-containing protein [Geoalkalibacter subterraneus]AJF08221.1 hypothetical protein GSUB_17180 [Geoalkalibacter subterraneus]